jgi:hypothetical protein
MRSLETSNEMKHPHLDEIALCVSLGTLFSGGCDNR